MCPQPSHTGASPIISSSCASSAPCASCAVRFVGRATRRRGGGSDAGASDAGAAGSSATSARHGRIFDRSRRFGRLHLREVVALQVLHAEHAEDVVDDRRRELDVRVAARPTPCGSKRVNVNCSTNVSSGTPYCRPTDTDIAKQFISERKAAPSLCMSMKISPSEPSSYSPVRRKTLCPPTCASCVKPRRFLGSRTRWPSGLTAAVRAVVLGDERCAAGIEMSSSLFASALVRLLARRVERLRRLAAVAVERDRLEPELPALLVDLAHVVDGGVVRQVHRLRDRARQERLRRRHHLARGTSARGSAGRLAAAVRAVEHRVVLGAQVRRALDRHASDDHVVRFVDLAAR